MKNIGIWMDTQKAHVVFLNGDKEVFETIFSGVEDYHVSGGSGTRFKGGPQDVVQDSRYLERQKHQLRSYFKNLVNVVAGAEAIAIFGPAETPQKFRKELDANHRELAAKVITVTKADSMTDNQIKALVKDFFQSSK